MLRSCITELVVKYTLDPLSFYEADLTSPGVGLMSADTISHVGEVTCILLATHARAFVVIVLDVAENSSC
jgi:hypothetical protein